METRFRLGRRVLLALFAALALLPGCRRTLEWAAMPFLYDRVALPEEQVVRGVAYRSGDASQAEKHRLDFFLPRAVVRWPVVVFVHGGGWTSGDRALRVGGADVYGNIGRYFASHGIGAAVVSYRLQPDVAWPDQVEDVASAVAWVRGNVAKLGGDPDAVFVMGHSAGAQLAAHVALDRELRPRVGGVCGLIPVSGAAFDLADESTYELGADREYYEERFRNGEPGDAWKREASPTRFVGPDAPPTLILVAEDDWPSLHRQAELLKAALDGAGVPARLVEVAGEDHYTVVLALTRDDEAAGPTVLDFIRNRGCQRS